METLLRAGLSNAAAAAIMALFVTCLSRPLARRPAILHGLWLLVLAKLITPPFYELPVPWPVSSPAVESVGTECRVAEAGPDTEGVAEVEALDAMVDITAFPAPSDRGRVGAHGLPGSGAIRLSLAESLGWIVAAWLVGSASVLIVSLRRIVRFQRRLADAREASWLEQEWVDDWAGRLGLGRSPRLLWVPGRISPMIWFFGPSPRLIIPEGLWKRLDGQQRSTLLAHELAHLRRGDHYVRLLELLATALFWWHPLVWWMRGPLRDVEEQCCDAWVVWALPDAVRSYAETLLDTLEFLDKSGRPEPLLSSGLGKVPHLRRRLTMIMTGSSRRLPGLAGKLGLLAAAGAMLPIGATWAQKADDPKPVAVVVKSVEDGAEVSGAGDLDIVAVAVTADQPAADSDATVLRYEAQGKPITVVGSGSIDDVVKQLLAQIEKLKKAEGSSDGAKEQIEALTRAIEEIKKAAGGPRLANIRTESVLRGRLTTSKPPAKNAAEIEKLVAEVAKRRKLLDANLMEIEAIQAKIRGLGGDAGDVPLVRWARIPIGADALTFRYVVNTGKPHVQTYTIAKPVADKLAQVHVKEMKIAADHPAKIGVKPSSPLKIEVAAPIEAINARLRIKQEPQKPGAAEAVDVLKLEALEKKLKALQDEVDRLKKATRPNNVD
jgi:beta-lactamase regulating signal transducer with metallopeptidase domain